MCGIAGYIDLKGELASPFILNKMIDSLNHRGPDGNGLYAKDHVGLCHTRLKIIDLTEAGSQPMVTSDGRYVLIYNGEIYNYLEIKKELEQKGYIFKSKTDTEVLLYGFAEWGKNIISRLNGMFAFAILDKKDNSLYLARDRYGIKPLYYFVNSKTFIFASEVKAILSHPNIDNMQLNELGLMEYFTFQNFISEQTLFKDINLFPAGNFVRISLNEKKPEYFNQLKFQKYWDFNFGGKTSNNDLPTNSLSSLKLLFEQAVNRQLIGEVKFGAYLSGGIDSGSIATFASKSFDDFYTYTCGFNASEGVQEDLIFDERNDAELIAAKLNSRHYEVVVKPSDIFKVFEELSFAVEEPRVGQSYPNFCLAGLASKFSRVVFSGAGGDELFGGYPWRYEVLRKNDYYSAEDSFYHYWERLIPDSEKREFFAPIWDKVKHYDVRQIFNQKFNPEKLVTNKFEDWVNLALSFEAKTFLQGLLIVEDKISMAHSMETRVPFLDNDLVDYALGVPVSLKMGHTNNLPLKIEPLSPNFPITNGKIILRDMLAQYVPEQIAHRRKQGFSAPDATWFKKECLQDIESILFNKNAAIFSFINYNYVRRILADHNSGKGNLRLIIWSLLYFEYFLNSFSLSSSIKNKILSKQ